MEFRKERSGGQGKLLGRGLRWGWKGGGSLKWRGMGECQEEDNNASKDKGAVSHQVKVGKERQLGYQARATGHQEGSPGRWNSRAAT